MGVGDCVASLKRKIIDCVCKDYRDKIKVPDPVVKDLISSKL